MFLSQELNRKLCQIYTKIYIYKILYEIVSLNGSYHIQQIHNQSENDDIPEEPK